MAIVGGDISRYFLLVLRMVVGGEIDNLPEGVDLSLSDLIPESIQNRLPGS